MRLEREIQEWIVQLAKPSGPAARNIASVLRYDDSQLSEEMRRCVARVGPKSKLAAHWHRSAHEACRVLQSLVEPRFRSANTNISDENGIVLKPDLVLEDEVSGAFIIVELKRSRKAAREFATELLAYANCLVRQHPHSQVFLVLVSTSWAPLEQHALAELARHDIPVLALQYREEPNEASAHLWVRSDLLPVTGVNQFPADALQVETKVFLMPSNWRFNADTRTRLTNRIEHSVAALIREAERGGSSGFALVWLLPTDLTTLHDRRSEVRVFVSIAICNPIRNESLNEFSKDPFHTTLPTLSDDTAIRLLLKLELGDGIQHFSSESEGTWNDLYARLEHEDALLLRFYGFGEIGDRVSEWRTYKRHALRPLVADVTDFFAWHPITWLPALDSLVNTNKERDSHSVELDAFEHGKNLGKYYGTHTFKGRDKNFRKTTNEARFVHTWCQNFGTLHNTPKISASASRSEFLIKYLDLHEAIEFAAKCVEQEGNLAKYCFSLGYGAGSGHYNIEALLSERSKLQAEGISPPKELDKTLEELDHHAHPQHPRATNNDVPRPT